MCCASGGVRNVVKKSGDVGFWSLDGRYNLDEHDEDIEAVVFLCPKYFVMRCIRGGGPGRSISEFDERFFRDAWMCG